MQCASLQITTRRNLLNFLQIAMRWSEYEHKKVNMNTATTNVHGNSKNQTCSLLPLWQRRFSQLINVKTPSKNTTGIGIVNVIPLRIFSIVLVHKKPGRTMPRNPITTDRIAIIAVRHPPPPHSNQHGDNHCLRPKGANTGGTQLTAAQKNE